MKRAGIISTAVLSLTLGVAAPAFAQQEPHDRQEEQKARSAQDEKKAQPAEPAKQDEKKAQQQDENNKEKERSAQQDRNSKPDEKNVERQDKYNKQEDKNAQQQHSQPAQRASNNGGGRIPDDRYRANFGQEHRFRVNQGDYRNRRFQYGGYWFGFVDPWPSDWLYTQDVFVVEINGMYYLCNPSYPGVNLAISVDL